MRRRGRVRRGLGAELIAALAYRAVRLPGERLASGHEDVERGVVRSVVLRASDRNVVAACFDCVASGGDVLREVTRNRAALVVAIVPFAIGEAASEVGDATILRTSENRPEAVGSRRRPRRRRGRGRRWRWSSCGRDAGAKVEAAVGN